MGLAVVSLMVLAVLGALGGLVLARLFGVASRRNERRPDGGGGEAVSAQGRPTDEDMRREAEAVKSAGPLLGAAVAALGVLLGVAGALFATLEVSFMDAVPTASMGIVLGLVGYFLGARRLGKAAAIVAAVAPILGLAVSQGYVPGLDPTDRGLPAKEPRAGQ